MHGALARTLHFLLRRENRSEQSSFHVLTQQIDCHASEKDAVESAAGCSKLPLDLKRRDGTWTRDAEEENDLTNSSATCHQKRVVQRSLFDRPCCVARKVESTQTNKITRW